MKYKTQIIKYRGKFIPVVKTSLGFEGIERERVSWFKKKYSFTTWLTPEYIERHCSYRTYTKASEVLKSYLEYRDEEDRFKERLKG